MESSNKRIIICDNGLWSPTYNPTNVTKLIQAINPISSDGIQQIIYTGRDVGSYSFLDTILGSTFGKGLKQNILGAYRFVALNYQPGDEIYCFGASRGAYVVRALAGMLRDVGLLPKDELQFLAAAYKYYRTPSNKRLPKTYAHYIRPEITMLGGWDTVGSLGVPTPILGKLTKINVGYFDNHLNSEIKNAYQALAIDEKRDLLAPALWTGNITDEQTVEQVWFAGSHSDICGGRAETGLADTALKWMIQKAILLGLDFNERYLDDTLKIYADELDVIHDSYSEYYRTLEKIGIENILRPLDGPTNETPINVSIHESVVDRIDNVDDYSPSNFVNSLPIACTDERRYFRHVSVSKLEGNIHLDSKPTVCNIIDFSTHGGVQIECDESLEVAGSITISSDKFPKMEASCAWRNGNVYGLKFAS